MRSRTLSLAATLAVAMLSSPVIAQDVAPSRIVSIGGAVTEILYALGQADRIVAVDTTSLHPAAALLEKPNVGYMRSLSAEGVLSLSPDLIVMEDGAGPPEAVALIDGAGVPVRHVPSGYTAGDLVGKIEGVAQAVGREDEGRAMADAVESDLDAIAADVAALPARRRVLFVLSVVDGRPRAAGRDTGADAVIGLAGATNVLADVEGYQTLSNEAIIALRPDVILTVERAGSPGIDPLDIPALAATPAGESGTLIRMDALYLLGFGPRTPAAIRDLAGRLYPELAVDDGQ